MRIKGNLIIMPKVSVALLILLFPVYSFSQDNWSLDFEASIKESFRTISTNDPDAQVVLDARNQNEIPLITPAVKIGANRRIVANTWFSFGIGLTNDGYVLKEEGNILFPDGGNGGLDRLSITTNYLMMDVPLSVRFVKPISKTWELFIDPGISLSLLFIERTTTISEPGTSISISNRRLLQALSFGTLKTGFNYNINKRLQIFGQLKGQYGLHPVKSAPIKEHLYHLGGGIGCRMLLGPMFVHPAEY